ncbi:MAG: AEC family transporter, partial [Vallitaleaceae bacterium]|nr:AEC family transporter [Vallitaleaceae bacterium]
AAVFYAAIINLPFNLLAYTLGIYFVSMNTGVASAFKWKKMINAGVLSVFVGLILLGFDIVLPNFMQDTIGMIGGLTTPLSMLVIGASLAHVKMKTLFTNKRLYAYCLIRLIIFPGLVYFALTALGIEGIILGVAVVLSGMPAAANTVMMSKEYGGNDLLAAEGVFISTMLSALTIPLLALLLT